MLTILREELAKHKVFDKPAHPFVDALVAAIPFSTVPLKMKQVFAIAHLSCFATQFRRNVLLDDGTPVPVNNLSFVIADSGANKDSTHNKIKKCFGPGYQELKEYNTNWAIAKAKQDAEMAGEELYEERAIYSKYLLPVPPEFSSFTTGPGLVQYINDMAKLPAMSSMVYTGELSDELSQNPHALENIKILSELFDLGNKEVTYLKSAEHRSDEIRQQAVSALMVGSPGHILYDDVTKKRFHVAFMSKLARRSWFCYTPERLFDPDFTTEDDPIQAAIDYEAKLEADSQKAAGLVQLGVKEVTEFNIGRLGIDMPITDEVFNLFNLYKRYNREVVNGLANRESVYALVRSHLQWKALKLAGAFAIMGKQDTVTAKHYITAVQYAELFDKDIATFEQDINKAPHESMADFMKTLLNEDNKAFLSAHDIKKQGFSTTTSTPKLQELVSLCAGYDLDGVYSLADNGAGIRYEPVKRSDTIGISFKAMDFQQLYDAIAANVSAAELSNIKKRLGAQANTGYTYGECPFADLGVMLSKDYAYCPFEFAGGNRARDGVLGGTKWLVMDVDKTTMSADDAHLVLGGINHHIALTSDADNNYRYRVIIELDAVVTLDALEWKRFFVAIANDLGIDVDVLPQSQIFFSYSNRKTLSHVNGRPLETRDYIMKAKERGAATLTPSELSKREQNVQLNNPMETFWYAYEASAGRRSTLYYRAMRHAKDLGADLDYTKKLLEDINDYIVTPMDPSRFEKLLQQAERLFTED